MPNGKNKLYVADGRISDKASSNAVEVTYSGPPPDYLIRINLPDGPHYFADKSEAAHLLEATNAVEVSLLPVKLDATG